MADFDQLNLTGKAISSSYQYLLLQTGSKIVKSDGNIYRDFVNYISTASINTANGVAGLDANGNLSAAVIPLQDTEANLSSIIPASGEPVFATDTYHYFVGNGTSSISELTPQFFGPLNTSTGHTEGQQTTASGDFSHAEGYFTSVTVDAPFAHAEGESTTALAQAAHAEGLNTTAGGPQSHAEGDSTFASGDQSHTEGSHTSTQGTAAHAEGLLTTAFADYTHAEGQQTAAWGDHSHAEGERTYTGGTGAHSEGLATSASNDYSHAEGSGSISAGIYSHAQGIFTITSGSGQAAMGIYNTKGNTGSLVVIGNGSSNTVRSDLATFSSQSIKFNQPLQQAPSSGSNSSNPTLTGSFTVELTAAGLLFRVRDFTGQVKTGTVTLT